MDYSIVSDRPLSDLEISRISGIMKESNCPHESLLETISGYTRIDENTIIIGQEGGEYSYEC